MSDHKQTSTIGSFAAAGRYTKRKNDDGLTLLAPVPMAFRGKILDANTPGSVIDAAGGSTQLILPKGFTPLYMVWIGSVTGTAPTIDIGTAGDADGFGNEVDADGNELQVAGALFGTELSADTGVTYTDGASVPTGGTGELWIHGVMEQSAADKTIYMS